MMALRISFASSRGFCDRTSLGQSTSGRWHHGVPCTSRKLSPYMQVRKRDLVGYVLPDSVPPVSFDETSTALRSACWQEFTKNAAGEWDGVSATYSPDGKVVPLPDMYIPDANKEWGIETTDWQTQCSMRVNYDGMEYTLRRLYSGTGCECDSVAQSDTFTGVSFIPERPVEDKTIIPSGSYSTGNVSFPDGKSEKLRTEACFRDRTEKFRFRVVVLMKKAEDNNNLHDWKFDAIEVHKEAYVCNYKNGLDVEDFGRVPMKLMSRQQSLDETITGIWAISMDYRFLVDQIDYSVNRDFSSMGGFCMWGTDDTHLVELPEGLWCSVAVHADFPDVEEFDEDIDSEENGYISIQCGQLLDNGQLNVWTRTYKENFGLIAAKYIECDKADDFQ